MEKKMDFHRRYMNGKSPICIENEKIEKARKSLAAKTVQEKSDLFENAKFTIFFQIGDFPFRKEFFQRIFQPPIRYKVILLHR